MRPISMQDREAIVGALSVGTVVRWAPDVPQPVTSQNVAAWVTSLQEGHADRSALTYGLICAHSKRFIGMVGAEIAPDRETADLGYWLVRERWGQGLATEAARAFLSLLCAFLPLKNLTASAVCGNDASLQVCEKLGFTCDKEPHAGRPSHTPICHCRMAVADFLAQEKLLPVSALALSDGNGGIMLAERLHEGASSSWEFPGGKIHDGETAAEALSREIHEELAYDLPPEGLAPLALVVHPYPDFMLVMPLLGAQVAERPIMRPQDGQKIVWCPSEEVGTHNLLAGDALLARVLYG